MGIGTLLIRADASPEIGIGHIMRCLALAQAWQDAGGSVSFAMASCTPAIRARLQREKCGTVLIKEVAGSTGDAARTRELAERGQVEWLVLDSYEFSSDYQHRVKGENWGLLSIDDEGKCEHYFGDIVLNQNITADRSWYANCLPKTQLLLGTSFCLLRREFAQWHQWKRDIPAIARNVLVTLGGSAPLLVALALIESLSKISIKEINVSFVLGGSAANEEQIEKLVKQFPCKISVLKNVSNMSRVLSDADVALSAAGSTCWELCLMGLPSVLLDLASNQTPVARELERRGCALYGGSGQSISTAELAQTIEEILLSPELRERVSKQARQLVDGCGAERVVSILQRDRKPRELIAAGASH